MMPSPRVSVIIPIYNTEAYLHECLLSVQRQTMGEFEAILVNDCTPDNSMQIAQQFANSDPRFRILEHEINKGLGGARNTGMSVAKGEYLGFLDSDDLLPVDALQVLLSLTQDQPEMVVGNMAWYYQHHLSLVGYINSRLQSWATTGLTNLRSLPNVNYYSGNVGNRLFSQKLITEHNIRFHEQLYFEDMPFSIETWHLSKRIAATLRIVNFHTRRDDPNNPSITQTFNEKAFYDRDSISQHVFNFASQQSGAAHLGTITLQRILATSKDMLECTNKDIRLKIHATWFPQHAIRINTMVNRLNKILSK